MGNIALRYVKDNKIYFLQPNNDNNIFYIIIVLFIIFFIIKILIK